jgi:hypothetical protein
MLCNKCGKELSENAKFCWSCGASIEPAADVPIADEVLVSQAPDAEIPVIQETPEEPVREVPVFEEPVWAAPADPAPEPKKKRKKWIPFAILGGAIAAVAAIVLTMFFNGFFDSDETTLLKALEKSAKAFAEAGDALGIPDLQYIQDENAYSADFAFILNNVQGKEELCGLGLSAAMDWNLPAKKLDMILSPSYGSVDLLNVKMKVDNNMAYLGSPQITGDRFYSFNTETMFADLSKLGVDVEGMEDIRINLFELMQILSESMMNSTENQEQINNAVKKLIDSIDTKMVGSEEITVNGHDLMCDEYKVVLKKEAVLEYYEAVLQLMTTTDMTDWGTKLCESLNIPAEMMNLSATEADTDEIMESLEEALDEYGDIELTFYLKDGYVMAVAFDINFEDTPLKCVLSIGGGDNYVDDLSLALTADGQTILLESSGNHTGKNGKFTDNTKLSIKGQGFSMTFLNSSLSFDSKKGEENLQWSLSLAGIALHVSGNVSYDSKSICVDLNDIGLTQSGEELLAFSLFYEVGEYKESIQVGDSLELLKLPEDALKEELTTFTENAQQWAMGMADQIPELLGLLV